MGTRKNIYYWKCDRPSAFFAIKEGNEGNAKEVQEELGVLLTNYFGSEHFSLSSAGGQGNHLTFLASRNNESYFVRVENGPEKDDYMEVETTIINRVHDIGIPTPNIYAVDSSRIKYDFAWQIMENVEFSDLNRIYKSHKLQTRTVMRELGTYIARWQSISTDGFGPYNSDILRVDGRLEGLYSTYRDYYMLNIEKHFDFLVQHSFLTKEKADSFLGAVVANLKFLDISRGCLVHKDLALWNVLGTEDCIKAVIDWDDTISGDPTDDISLMACFHSKEEMNALIEGYQEIKPLPENFIPRFWLHLMRNMLFKAVIRVGAGYFKKDSNYFLINSGSEGGLGLHNFTLSRLELAYEGLTELKSMDDL